MGQAKRKKQALGASYGQQPEVVWHYTSEYKVPGICREGLRDVFYGTGVVWFTSSESKDPTSRDALSAISSLLPGTYGRSWRIGVSGQKVEHFRSSRLIDNPSTYTIGLPPKVTAAWYVSTAISAEDILHYQMLIDGRWVEANPFDIQTPDFVMAPEQQFHDENRTLCISHSKVEMEIQTFRETTGTSSPIVIHSSGMYMIDRDLAMSNPDMWAELV